MDISAFTRKLHSDLLKLGIPGDIADQYISVARKGLASKDVINMKESDVASFAKVCAAQIKSKNPGIVPSDEHTDVDSDEIFLGDVFIDEPADDKISTVTPDEDSTKLFTPVENPSPAEDIPVFDTAAAPKKTWLFILITVLTSPLWAVAAVLFTAPFIAIFLAEAVLTAAFVCMLAGFAAFGTAAALTGIVYGIIQIFSIPAVGLYEIGFGVIVAGVTMILGILTYNATVRLMPWLFKKSGELFKFVFSKIKPLLSKYKRRCESL